MLLDLKTSKTLLSFGHTKLEKIEEIMDGGLVQCNWNVSENISFNKIAYNILRSNLFNIIQKLTFAPRFKNWRGSSGG
jgi:hypothetical protein